MLPLVMRWLGLARDGAAERISEKEAELRARHAAREAAERRLESLTTDGQVPAEVSALLKARNDQRTQQMPRTIDDGFEMAAANARLRLELIEAERAYLHQLLREGKITDESRRRLERELDLEEASIACKAEGGELPL